MKILKIAVVCFVCLVLVAGALGAVMFAPSAAVVQAIGPLQSPIPTPKPKPDVGCFVRRGVGANLRTGPGLRFRIKARLPGGTRFTPKARRGAWSYGRTAYGLGWVLASRLVC